MGYLPFFATEATATSSVGPNAAINVKAAAMV